MKKKYQGFNLFWVLIIVAITSIISALTAGVIVYNNNKVSKTLTYKDLADDKNLSQFLEIYGSITSEYYESVNKEEMLEKAIAAMMEYLGDDYTTYMDDESTTDLVNELSGEYKGIGVAINSDNKTITKVYDDTPASKAGIKEGDIIIKFNEKDVTTIETNELVNLIKISEDKFTLTLKRNDEIITVKLKNEIIISPNIEYEIIEGTSIGYLYISAFSSTLGTQVENALKKLEKEKITSLIIDVRNNTGGYLDATIDVASLFLKKGKNILSLDYKDEITSYKDETFEHRDYEIVVLINGNTASASEILAAAMKESYGATIVGTQSFGKGKVQQTMNLDGGSMVKYTSAYWLTPNGNCIDEVGVEPDYYVSSEEETNPDGTTKDKQLETAINVLNK